MICYRLNLFKSKVNIEYVYLNARELTKKNDQFSLCGRAGCLIRCKHKSPAILLGIRLLIYFTLQKMQKCEVQTVEKL